MKLSICLACYNGELFIREQIESILPQVIDGDEFLVGDDGSTDGTLEILREYGSQITKVTEGRAGGVNQNFERLIEISKNPGVVLCDQDDVWLPGRLSLIREALKTSSLVVTNGFVVDEKLNSADKTVFEFVGYRRGFLKNFIKNSYVGCCMAFRRELVAGAIPFDNDLHAHDWLIGLLGEIDGRISVISEPSLLYRRHAVNLSRTGKKSSNSLIQKIAMRYKLSRMINFNILK